MAYMSYCRFEGTQIELQNCLYDVEDHMTEQAEYPVSESEIGHFQSMVEDFYYWMNDVGLLNEFGELDEEVLNDICDKMKNGRAEM